MILTSPDYRSFLLRKTQIGSNDGFDPLWMPDCLFGFQHALVDWGIRKGRAAIFADCGLGKTLMQLVCAENIARKTGGKVLIICPLAVAPQTVREGQKFGVDVVLSRDGDSQGGRIIITNYQMLHRFNPADFAGAIADESGAIKAFDGKLRKQVVRFFSKLEYRFLFTATPSPNDFIELGTQHVCPLQLDVIDRCLDLWSNEGDTILTPFMGVGSEAYEAVRKGRRAIGVELKPTYFRQAHQNLEAVEERQLESNFEMGDAEEIAHV